eukprot:scaffold1459_cov260-Pinguiococcus_pyrenoidosus.AAC.6
MALPAPEQRWGAFVSGLQGVLQSWTALNLAVENNWGGGDSHKKAQELFEALLEVFRRGRDIYADVVEDVLLVRMDESFHTRCDDGSIEEVSRLLVQMYHDCGNGDFSKVNETLERLRERQERGVSAARESQGQVEAASSDEGGGEGGDNDAGDDDGEFGDADGDGDGDGDAMNEEEEMDTEAAGPGITGDGNPASHAQLEDDGEGGWQTVPSRKGRRGNRRRNG